jgi:hypothetical protein
MGEDLKTDKLITPKLASRYRRIGVIPGWTREQFTRLCALMNRSPEEVGAFAGLSPRETRDAMTRGRFSPPASLHFAIFYASLRAVKYGEPEPEPIVPLDL